MASIFDQYESQQQPSGPTSLSQSILGTTTFMNLKLEDESAIFSKLRVSYLPPHPVTHLVVSNNHLVMALAIKELIKKDLRQPDLLEKVDLSKLALQAKIHKIFLDPSGQHILVSISSKDSSTAVDTIYLPWSNGKPKSTSKLKGYLVTAVAWNQRNHSENLTGPILMGTSRGVILEMELTSDEKMFQSGHEQYCKVMFDLGKEGPVAITALEVHCCPTNDQLYLILATTTDKLYQFMGHTKGTDEKPFFTTIFNNYLALPLKPVDLPSNWKSSVLQLYSVPNTLIAKHLAWMTEQGVYTAEISWPLSAQDDMTVNRKLHTYPENCDASNPPCGMIVTEFHILIVWPDKVRGICFLNNQVVFEDRIPEDCGRLVGITKDTVKGTIWVFAERGVFKYKVEREGRNVWRIHLEQGNYELAKQHCSGDLSNLSIVHLQEAQDLFQKRHYVKSAKLFAKTFSSFEEVSLKFVKVGEEEALKIYLLEKLAGLKVSEQTQVTLIVMWLIELYLKKLGNLRDAGQRNSADYHNCDEEFKSFLKDPKVKQCISNNAGSIYSLLASHDDQDNFVSIAVMLKDFDRVINQLINHGRHIEALEILNTQGSEQLFYQHIPTLLQAIPRPTVDALIGQGKRLSCVRLLPSLVHAHTTHGLGTEVLRYLEHCIDKLDVTDQVVHNFLITLYACLSPEKLLPYLKLQGDDGMSVSYDVKFALRECMSAGEERACVHILTTMGLYQDAVEMALKFDTALAKATANRPRHDQDLRKKLWLMIASHVVQKEQDVARAMEVLKECELIKIEDILPFFPDFVTIDQFKDAICASLQDYNQHIEDLKTEMDDASKAAENIRKDIQKFKQKFSYIHAQDRCCECNYPLLARPFYLFPCSHKFHQDCLSDAILMYLSDTKQRKISELKGKLLAMSNENNGPDGSGWSVRDQIQMEIDSLVAGECFYCGDALVSNVDTPFIDPGEWESLMQEWQ